MSFDVWWTPAGAASAKKLDKPIADAVDRVESELERVGCAVASYRLTGEILEHICVVHLPYDYRMLVAFPSDQEVSILLVGRHVRSPALDVYARLYRALDLQPPPEERTKPPCCDAENDEPPVDGELVDRFRDGVKRLRRESRPVQSPSR
ncbi:MAG: hypothetical protein ACLQQB_09850 [Solirubrobacteraceae bacterium]